MSWEPTRASISSTSDGHFELLISNSDTVEKASRARYLARIAWSRGVTSVSHNYDVATEERAQLQEDRANGR